ncbi:MAG: type I glyceraldehyde-3-phosphate dehydrogenase [Patescibacteria group bacterium]|nr:type I glyceraldehyde-3-phosphate dehydrogenase [Patescibacteria group bacterium]MDD5490343.1 type I glyceraldehyde-3-phosphate dehydrogenase [Patescibacteria group bacterium]
MSKKIRVAINGFGRIGRTTFKAGFGKEGIEWVAVNDLTDAKTLAYLLKYDSVYHEYHRKVRATKNEIIVDGQRIKVFAERDPKNLPWKELNIDVVLECTGIFTNEEGASQHLTAGAKRVIISAPAKGGHVPTYVLGVNSHKYKKSEKVINNASCTTNCIAPVAAIIQSHFGIKKALMTTIHAYTADQNLVDGPHKDLRRARSAAINIIPTTTGAAISTGEIIPAIRGKFDGLAIRVPVAVGSLSDFTFLTKKKTTVERVNNIFRKMAKHPFYKNILAVTDRPIVSSDIIGNEYSAVVDLSLTKVVDGDLVKVIAWYDNELGYSHRLAELAREVGRKI